MPAPNSRFVKACKALPVDRTPVWFMRQAGRYMAEYRAVRKEHSLIEICKNPRLAAEVTITAWTCPFISPMGKGRWWKIR
jgi:uroporphyrinogen decarboxylase